MSIDYERMKQVFPKQKANLTRAKKISDPTKRYVAVRTACAAAVQEWNVIGAWPDGWATWQCALRDAAYAAARADASAVSYVYNLEDL